MGQGDHERYHIDRGGAIMGPATSFTDRERPHSGEPSLVRRGKVKLAPLAIVAVVATGVLVGLFLGPFSWDHAAMDQDAERPKNESREPPSPNIADDTASDRAQRSDMVEMQIRARGVRDERVLQAMRRVPRHLFVPRAARAAAYADSPQPIGYGQTISQPYIVALMTELARTKPTSKALDVGTGSGYQAAVLAELCDHVYSIEIIEPLAEAARHRLQQLGYDNVTVRSGDGYGGWPEHAPFDVIIVAAAPNHVPQPLIDQLAPGGRLVIPVGDHLQQLILIEKRPNGEVVQSKVAPVAFVPMTGQAREQTEK